MPAGEASLRAAQKAYKEGSEALEKDQFKPAFQKLDEAQLLAHKAMEELDRRGQSARNEAEVQKVAQLQGEALWTKAQALRDKFYADRGAAGEPLPTTLDTSTGQHFRSLLRVANRDDLIEAIRCQRAAAQRLPQREDVLLDTLRTEVSLAVPDWLLLETLAKATLALNPKDTRALYLAARLEFEQLRSDGKGPPAPMPEDRRSRDRLLKAREYLTSPGADKIPPFRKMYLEAQIARLLRDQYAKARRQKESDQEAQTLTKLVLDPQTSALATAMSAAKDFKGLSPWDFDGVIGLHVLALDRVLEDLAGSTADPTPARALLGRLMTFAQTQSGEDGNLEAFGKAALASVDGAARVQPYFESRFDPEWRKTLDALQALVKVAQERKVGILALFGNLSQLLGREAVLEGKRGNKERQEELKNAAKKWLDEGLKTTSLDEQSNGRFDLLVLGADRAALAGKRDETLGYLATLRQFQRPVTAPIVALLDALLLEREGKLDRARQELEKVLSSPFPALHLRAHLLLAQLYRSLNQPEKALDSLLYINRVTTGFDSLPEIERTWAQQFHASSEAVTAQLVLAHLGTARAKLRRYLQANGGQAEGVATLLQPHEVAVEGLLKKLPRKSPLELIARQDWIAYRAQTGRAEQARQELATLRADFPDSVDLLRLEVHLLQVPALGTKPAAKIEPKVRDAADRLIDQFVTANPTSEAGRLFRTQWLIRTERPAQAVAQLQDRKSFPTDSPAQQQMLALALLAAGQKKESLTVLQHLPDSPGIDALLIRLAESRAEKTSRLEAALKRYERSSLFQCWDGERRLAEGKYPEAIACFREAIEVTSVRSLAEQGLRRTLFELAQKDPKTACDLARKLADDLPQEPLPVLAVAYALLVLGDLGTPEDGWPRVQTMSAALNGWEARMNAAGNDKVAIALTRSEFYALANNVARARAETERALKLAPTNAGALLRGINLGLVQPTPSALDQAEQYLKGLVAAQPDSPDTLFASGRLAEARGKLDDAVTAYEKILEKTPGEAMVNQRLVGVLERKKALDRVSARLETWTKVAPEAPLPKLLRVKYLAQSGQVAAAVEAGRQLVEDSAQAAEKLASGTGKVARQAVRLEVGRQLLAGAALSSTEVNRSSEAAETWIGALLADAPDLLEAQLLRGDWLLMRKRYTDACELYRKVLLKNPDHLIAANNLAYLLGVEMNRPAEADEVVRATRQNRFTGQVIPGDRLNPDFLDTIGLIYQKLNQPERLPEMRDLFERAWTRYPDDPRVAWHLGFALLGLKEEDRARVLLDQAAQLVADGSGRLTPDERTAVGKGIEQLRRTLH
jgi:predicted Zn-dependent protease